MKRGIYGPLGVVPRAGTAGTLVTAGLDNPILGETVASRVIKSSHVSLGLVSGGLEAKHTH